MRIVWLLGSLLSLGLGLLGIVLPLLPTVPLILLAAFCFARSSDRLHNWLLKHPRLGPPIKAWRQTGAISRAGKLWATASMAAPFLISVAMGLSAVILAVQAATLGAVALFIWTRPQA
ncbi:MAG: YbaN family protein [Rhodobacterales bacterium]|nr:YbaN family protein [Rhodobacterales bacterium]